jgi:hypothetical protein
MRPIMLGSAIVCATLAVASSAAAQPPRNRAPLPNEQWVQLFNGKDLTNWVEVGKEKWTVEDGTIHGQGVTSAYGYLRTEKKYKDFWLAIRFKCEADGNSGVYFHTDFKPGTVDVSQGKQFEIDRVMNHHTGGLYGDGRGWFAWPSAEYEHVIRPTDWNDMLLKVEGNHMVAILNGITVMDFTDPSPRSSDGYIALQLHSGGLGNMRFKDIYVRDLSVRTPAEGSQAAQQEFTTLFNGKDLTGWVYGQRANGTENKTGKGYQVENGVLFTTKEDGGNLFTEKQYADFVFQFDFKLTENANNGIGIRAPLQGDAAYVGIEIQVLDDGGSQYTKLQPAQYHGSIYHMFPAKRGHQKPVGEWNTEEITVKGRQITVKLNGVTITEGNLDDVKDEALLAKHRDLTKPEGSRGIANTRGHIGLLGHGTRVEFRNIRIKEL